MKKEEKFTDMKNKELSFTIEIEEKNKVKNFKLRSKEEGCHNFYFSSNDNESNNLDDFIDFLLSKVEEYDRLVIDTSNELVKNTINYDIACKFKQIWEDEFSKIKK